MPMNWVGKDRSWLDVVQQISSIAVSLRSLFTSKGCALSDGEIGTSKKKVGVEQGGPDANHLGSDDRVFPQRNAKPLDIRASRLAPYPKGAAAGAAICGGLDVSPVNIIQVFDAVVEDLRDEAAIEDAPEIKKELGLVVDAYGHVFKDIKEVDESKKRCFPDETWKNAGKADTAATKLYMWVQRIVSQKLDSSATMTKRAKLQVMPHIVALAYATRIRIITRLVERDMMSGEREKERYLDRAYDLVNDFIALLHKALEELMPNTSLLEIALDYQQPMATYLTLMIHFRASVDAIKSPNTKPKEKAVWDDGLSSIREALHWKPSGPSDQAQGSIIELKIVRESLWWASFTGTDPSSLNTGELRSSIDVRELSHVLGAGSDEFAAKLALKPDMKSALIRLPPASTLRDVLCANIAWACQEAQAPLSPLSPPRSFARTNAPLSPLDTVRSAAAPAPARSQAAAHTSLQAAAPACRQAAASLTLSGHVATVYSVAMCADGERVLSGSWDKTMRLWNLSSGQLLDTFFHHTDKVNCVAVSLDGKMALSGSSDTSVHIWSLDNGSLQRTLDGHSKPVWAVAVSPDGRSIASGSEDKTVKLWDADDEECQASLTGHSDTVICVAFGPDGERLVSGSCDKSIMVWNVHTGELECTLTGHSDAVTGVAVTPDGCSVVSSSADRTVKVWSLSSGAEEMSFEGHSSRINCVAVFPDGERIASGSNDKSVRVWNLRSSTLELTLTGHSSFVRSVAVSPDGQRVVSGSLDKTIKVWHLSGGGGGDG